MSPAARWRGAPHVSDEARRGQVRLLGHHREIRNKPDGMQEGIGGESRYGRRLPNGPSGTWCIGRAGRPSARKDIAMQVRDAMAKTIVTAHPSSTVKEVAVMMRREDCGFIPILRGEHLEGVVTDRDLVVRFCADGLAEGSLLTTPIADIMTKRPISIQADANLEDAGHLMAEHQIRRLVVLDGMRPVGVLSFGNLEQALHAHGECAEEVILGVTSGS